MTTVTASDLDLGANGIVRYTITGGNTNGAFAIGGMTSNEWLQW